MHRKLLFLAAVGLAGVLSAAPTIAQTQTSAARSNDSTLVGRLDQFGKRLFGGVFGDPPAQVPQPGLQQTVRQQAPREPASTGTSTGAPSAWSNSRQAVVRPSTTPAAQSPLGTRRSVAAPGATSSAAMVSPQMPINRTSPPSTASAAPSSSLETQRLHERLQYFRQSAFSDRVAQKPPTPSASSAGEAMSQSTSPTVAEPPKPAGQEPTPTVATPRNSVADSSTPTVAPQRAAASAPLGHQADAGEVLLSDDEPKTMLAEPKPPRNPWPSRRSDTLPSAPSQAEPTPEPVAMPEVARQASEPSARAEDRVLISRKSPVLSVETLGPRRITVGKESTYEVIIRNAGAVAAEQLVVAVAIPAWAEVRSARATRGTAAAAKDEAGGLRWQVGRLDGPGQETLTLRLIPRESRPFDLAVKWDYTPVISQAMIEVQEPKLELRLEGPREVLYGENEVYRLVLSNPGTGDAEQVQIQVASVGAGQSAPAVHQLGTLPSGEKKIVEVEFTARQTGTLTVEIEARSDSGAQARLTEQIAVYRPALALRVEGPGIQYVGNRGTYHVVVSNPGTAPARDVSVTAKLPSEAEYVAHTGDGKPSDDRSEVVWRLDAIEPGTEEVLALDCVLNRAGFSRIELASSAAGNLTAFQDATTRVETIADLDLTVVDPTGPIALDTEAAYEIRVRNRGSKSAEQVEVVVYFSEGVEPTSVEGGQYRIAPGQVLFDAIPSIPAGQDVTLQIRAKAGRSGSHICRVEVHCKPLDLRLVSEQTTRFYGRDGRPQESMISRDESSDARREAVRTAEREQPTPAEPKTTRQ